MFTGGLLFYTDVMDCGKRHTDTERLIIIIPLEVFRSRYSYNKKNRTENFRHSR